MKTITLLLFFYLTAFSFASSPREQVDAFVKTLKSGDAAESIKLLFSSNKLIGQNQQQLTMMSTQLETALKLYGVVESSDEVCEEEISARVLRISEITNHEHHPLSWEFIFYKVGDKWIISQALFGDQFQFIGKKK